MTSQLHCLLLCHPTSSQQTLLETKLLLYWVMVRETTGVTVAGECALHAGRHKRQADYRSAFVRSGYCHEATLQDLKMVGAGTGSSQCNWDPHNSEKFKNRAYVRLTGKGDRSEHGRKRQYSETIVSP